MKHSTCWKVELGATSFGFLENLFLKTEISDLNLDSLLFPKLVFIQPGFTAILFISLNILLDL